MRDVTIRVTDGIRAAGLNTPDIIPMDASLRMTMHGSVPGLPRAAASVPDGHPQGVTVETPCREPAKTTAAVLTITLIVGSAKTRITAPICGDPIQARTGFNQPEERKIIPT